MAEWVCPECRRPFGKRNQRHTCSPGLTIEEFFATAHERERPIFEAIRAHLEALGPLVIDPVQVGIFFKNGPNFAEIRPMTKWVAVTFKLPAKIEHGRLSRKVIPTGGSGSSWYHVVNVRDVSEVDEQLLGWLTAAYVATED